MLSHRRCLAVLACACAVTLTAGCSAKQPQTVTTRVHTVVATPTEQPSKQATPAESATPVETTTTPAQQPTSTKPTRVFAGTPQKVDSTMTIHVPEGWKVKGQEEAKGSASLDLEHPVTTAGLLIALDDAKLKYGPAALCNTWSKEMQKSWKVSRVVNPRKEFKDENGVLSSTCGFVGVSKKSGQQREVIITTAWRKASGAKPEKALVAVARFDLKPKKGTTDDQARDAGKKAADMTNEAIHLLGTTY